MDNENLKFKDGILLEKDSNEDEEPKKDLKFLLNHGHILSVIHRHRPNYYASTALNRVKLRDHMNVYKSRLLNF